jgi:hypothetical protein
MQEMREAGAYPQLLAVLYIVRDVTEFSKGKMIKTTIFPENDGPSRCPEGFAKRGALSTGRPAGCVV